MFDFSKLSNTSFVSTSSQRLKPYEIYRVKLTKIEKTELKGSKDPNMSYPVIALEFTSVDENNPGIFSENIFIPVTENDTIRPTFKNDKGHEYNRPSRFENFQYTLMQILETLNPEGATKIKENSAKIKTVDQFIDLIIKGITKGMDKETNLKLVGRNNNGTVYATLPSACGLNKSGELFATNFIGENLFFSNYELTQQKNYQNSKPTNMDKVDDEDISSNDEFDLDDLENSL